MTNNHITENDTNENSLIIPNKSQKTHYQKKLRDQKLKVENVNLKQEVQILKKQLEYAT